MTLLGQVMSTQEIPMITPVELDEESKELCQVLEEMKRQIHEATGIPGYMLKTLQIMIDRGPQRGTG